MGRLATPRYALMAGLLLTYIWRFHDLSVVLTPFRFAAICTVSSWIYLLVQPRIGVLKRATKLPYVWLFLVFSLWGWFSVLFALDPQVAWEGWSEAHFKQVTMFVFILTCLTSMASVRLAILVHVGGASVLVFYYIKGGFPQTHTPVPMYDRNDLAVLFNVTLPMVLYVAVSTRNMLARILLSALALGIAASVLMSGSRGGFLTLGVVATLILINVKGVRLRYRLLIPALFVAGLFVLPAEIQDRLRTLEDPTTDYNFTEDSGRIEIWKRGLGYLADNKLVGVGWMNFSTAERTLSEAARLGRGRPIAPHNSFLQVAVETGIPGVMLYVAMILTALFRLYRIRRWLRRIPPAAVTSDFLRCAEGLFLSIVAFCIGSQFLSIAYLPILFGQLALVAGLEMSIARWRQRQKGAVQRPRAAMV